MNPKEITRSVVIIILWLIVVIVMIMWLTGCEGTRTTESDVRSISISADFEKDTIDVELNKDKQEEQKEIEVTAP